MRTLRTALTAAALCLIAGGYAASQWAFFAGRTEEYARAVDIPAIKWVSLALLLSAVLLSFVRDNTRERESK